MDNQIKNIARTGYAAKGVVYALTGILAFGAAIGMGNSSEGKLGVLKFLEEQPFGKVLLGLLGLGLFCYAFWRIFQSIKDPENIGNDKKGLGKRIGFFFSGLVYMGLGIFAIYEIFKQINSGGSSKTAMIPTEFLPYIFYAIAIGMAIKALFQFAKIYKGDFLSKFHLNSMTNINLMKTIKWLGYAGWISRGIVEGVVAYFFFRAADTASQGDIKGTAEAFSFIRQNSEGPWLVGSVALGLICYGVYMFIKAKYRRFDD
ncbi:DUF1206 domain-containing protein [Arenibacter sp. BSSL-BM3]|uniref:DUF1206 domain-containing protein n=1 Tax=Arenibacter arenosicollis TaxID=2762274 RepID=A0ABR7QPX7_9FLAO|nr:DUF1206 domain-containing protein [Arenibacter arenosicollis]MBC8769251.1 DUF1206 domain-containing protein [Arenibacter arenosicollis]